MAKTAEAVELSVWMDPSGGVRHAAPFAPADRIVKVSVVNGVTTTQDLGDQVLKQYEAKGIDYKDTCDGALDWALDDNKSQEQKEKP